MAPPDSITPRSRAATPDLAKGSAKLAEAFPLRILLAEDVMVNQKVALSLLGKLGYRADVVSDGVEVVEALERQTYEVVFMDVQMPRLNGFGATQAIRQKTEQSDVPWIIAMTAHAMQGDRQLCLDSGMNDYVSKPIQLEAIEAALRRYRETCSLPSPPNPILPTPVLPTTGRSNDTPVFPRSPRENLPDLSSGSSDVLPVPQEQLQEHTLSTVETSMVETRDLSAFNRTDIPTEIPIVNLQILLAEDIPVNQQVALAMLRRLGYSAELAHHGREVLERLQQESYDVILMDIQMPHLDGLSTTRRIREQFGSATKPWIIALTANALPGDREKCLGAGMNDYVAKPMNLGAIREALRRYEQIHAERLR
jgi:CheY-like chemotaxis protein